MNAPAAVPASASSPRDAPSLFGMALAALVFFDRWRRGDRTMGYVAGLAFVLALIAFAIA